MDGRVDGEEVGRECGGRLEWDSGSDYGSKDLLR